MKTKIIAAALSALLLLSALSACGKRPDSEASSAPEPASEPTAAQTAAEKRLAEMSTEEKVGQLFIIRPAALDTSLTPAQISDASKYGVTELSDAMAETLKQYPAGGFAFFGKNITSPEQLEGFAGALNAARPSLFMAVDEEGGSVSRIANSKGFDVTKYDSMESVGDTGDAENARNVGVTIGAYLKKYGFNLDFAPDADVNTNPDNMVIGDRSFGSDGELVAKMVSAEIDGLHQSGVMSCAKHFPGHGDTKGDTHTQFVYVDKSWEQLQSCELIPFKAAIGAGTDMIMAAHIAARNVTDDDLPSSMSYEMITGKLRGELGYEGIVITDGMAMGAVTQRYSSAEAAVKAIQAGADIVLMPENYIEAFNGVLAAVKDGSISAARLDESVLRILELKDKYGLL